MTRRRMVFGLSLLVAALGATALAPGARADAVGDFYKGKRVSMMISSGVGGGYDLYARLVSRHMGGHLAGDPSFVAKNMPGAGGMKLLNFAYNQGPRDGTLIFTLHIGLPLHQALGRRGVRFDAAKIIGIGRVAAGNSITGVWHTVGVKTFADALKTEVVVGSTQPSSNSSVFPTVARNLLGAKIKIITGYKSGEQVMLAMERGEVQGFGSFGLASMQSTRPRYFKENLVYPLFQWGLKREAVWPEVPLVSELAGSELDRKAVEVLSAQMDIGRSYFMAPGVPRARVAALRAALKATAADPAFLKSAKRLKAEIRYASGEETEKLIADVLNAPPEVLARLKAAMAGGLRGACKDYSSRKVCRSKKKKKKRKSS